MSLVFPFYTPGMVCPFRRNNSFKFLLYVAFESIVKRTDQTFMYLLMLMLGHKEECSDFENSTYHFKIVGGKIRVKSNKMSGGLHKI